MTTPDRTPDAWFKSSYSQAQGDCLEVAMRPHTVGARDSKNPDGPALEFTRDGWNGFLRGLDAGDFNP